MDLDMDSEMESNRDSFSRRSMADSYRGLTGVVNVQRAQTNLKEVKARDDMILEDVEDEDGQNYLEDLVDELN